MFGLWISQDKPFVRYKKQCLTNITCFMLEPLFSDNCSIY